MRVALAIITGALLIAPAGPWAAAQSKSARPSGTSRGAGTLSAEERALVRKAIASVGLIMVRNFSDPPTPRPRASGVIIRSDGIVATNCHVIEDAKSGTPYDELLLYLSQDGAQGPRSSRYRLRPVLMKKKYDLALLEIVSDHAGNPLSPEIAFAALEMASPQSIELLDDLTVIGFPAKGGSTVTISRGVIEGKDSLGNWIKTDARTIQGNSGGAAVNSRGRLVGIPTKVEAEDQALDKNGDGKTDATRRYGAIGYLRPAHLLAEMLSELPEPKPRPKPAPTRATGAADSGKVVVAGTVRSVINGRPIAGALVGIVPPGADSITGENLLAWGNADANGEFKLNKALAPGAYTLKVRAMGYQLYSRDVRITRGMKMLVVEMRVQQ